MDIFAQPYDYTDPAALFAAVAHLPYSLLIDSADRDHPDARYSYILTNPLEIIEAHGSDITVSSGARLTHHNGKDPFAVAHSRLLARNGMDLPLAGLPPFQGGLAGLCGYDLARGLEALPASAQATSAMPDMALGLYDQVLAFDHDQRKAWIITHAKNDFEADMKRAVLQHNLNIPVFKTAQIPPRKVMWEPHFTREDYIARIQRVIDYIRDGDIFQANLSQQFSARLPDHFDPYAHYLHMRRINPAPFAAYMNLGEVQISSASPERFLHCDSAGLLTTKPIKGTAPRESDPATLQASVKDRAENIMITDLLRNDLSKCCEAGSIEVPHLCALESFTDVHHLVTTITGQLRAGQTPLDALRACFPGGSVTGAPKVRAMEIIEELEGLRRHAYCGALALAGFNGCMDSSILIRTLIFEGNAVRFNVGGGITALSDPAAEYDETLDKARSLFDSFAAPDTHRRLCA